MRSVNCQFLITFAGEDFKWFEVQEVVPAPTMINAIRGDEDAQQVIVEQLLRGEKRRQLFHRISVDLDWHVIWQNRGKIIMKEWDV